MDSEYKELKREVILFDKYVKTTYKGEQIIKLEKVCLFHIEDVFLSYYIEVTTPNHSERFYFMNEHDFNSIEGDSLTYIVSDSDFDFSKY